jgi:predicted ATP-dependent serine protease
MLHTAEYDLIAVKETPQILQFTVFLANSHHSIPVQSDAAYVEYDWIAVKETPRISQFTVFLANSHHSIPARSDAAFVGEVGLLEELPTVPALEKRLQEA